MKKITLISLMILVISHQPVACGGQDKGGDIARLLSNPKASTFEMTWHGGGAGKLEGMAVEPACLRVYHIQTLQTLPREWSGSTGRDTVYGQIRFSDFGQTKFTCGLRKSSEQVMGYDELFIDLNDNSRLDKKELFKGKYHDSTMGPDVVDCHYGPIDITLRGRDDRRLHRVFAWYHMLRPSRPGELYLTSQCYLYGQIHLGEKEVTAVLVDYNCDGCYGSGRTSPEWIGSLGPRELDYDRIGWDADGDGKIHWTEQHFIGSYLVLEGGVFQVGCTPDGQTLAVVAVETPMGRLQIPTRNAFVRLVGDIGPMNLRITNGAIDVPAGTYWVDYIHIDEVDDNGEVSRLRKSGRYFDKPWQIHAGVTIKIDRERCIVTYADKQNYEAKMRELRGEGPQPRIVSLLGEPLRNLDGFSIALDHAKLKDRRIIICFWDMQQRPSRHYIMQLAKRAEQFKQEGVTVVAVQASKIDENALNEWVKKNKISFPIGMVQGDEDKTPFTWGVRSLPWLILTDSQHVVTAEGFNIGELDDKLASIHKPITKEEIEKHRRSIAESEIQRLGGVLIKASEEDADYTTVSFSGPRSQREWKGGNWGARYLNDLANIKKLRIRDLETFTDEGVEHLRQLRSLESLMLVRTGVSDDGLVHFEGLGNLEFLGLMSNKFTDTGLEHIIGMTNLKSLRLDDAQITNEGLRRLKQSGLLTRLEFLVLNRTQITDAGLAYLQGMDRLKLLYLSETQVGDEGISHLATLSKLEGIILNDTSITDAGLAYLKGLGNLNMLYLRNTQITDTGLEHIEEMDNLVQLWVGGTKITNAGLVYLKALNKLESLDLSHTQVTNSGLSHLEGLTSLNELFLNYSGVTIDGYLDLNEALPDCQIYCEQKKDG